MDKRTIEEIHHLAKYMDEQSVAETLNLTVDIIKAVIRCDIEVENINTPAPPKIQVVENAKFVRNKTVMAISPGGGMGKTTVLTSLAVAAAMYVPNKRPIGIVDLAEFPKVVSALGIETENAIVDTAATILFWEDENDYTAAQIPHPVLNNLHIIPGVGTAENHLKVNADTMAAIISTLQNHFELLLVDLPAGLTYTERLLSYGDSILIVLTPDHGSVIGFLELLPTLKRLGLIDRSYIVVNKTGHPALLEPSQFCKIITASVRDHYSILDNSQIEFLGFLPETQSILEQLNGHVDNIILNDSNPDFTGEIKHILSKLCPDWQIKTEKNSSGIAGILGRFFK